MAKRKKTQEPLEDQNQTEPIHQESTATESQEGPTDEPTAPFQPVTRLPLIGDSMHYYDRDGYVASFDANREHVPHAAIVTGIEYLKENPDEALLQIAQLHPSEGLIVRRHVRVSDAPAPGCVCWKATAVVVPFAHLEAAARVALEHIIRSREEAGQNTSGETQGQGHAPEGGQGDNAST